MQADKRILYFIKIYLDMILKIFFEAFILKTVNLKSFISNYFFATHKSVQSPGNNSNGFKRIFETLRDNPLLKNIC